MFTLKNEQLTVDVLDPVADQERFGARYCTGGYIFQVHDQRHGPLLSGPTYPDSFNWFDGQGLPEAFNLGALRAPASTDLAAMVIGIGLCSISENRLESKVITFCEWSVEQGPQSIQMQTSQEYQGYALTLVREVGLYERTVRSANTVHNTGSLPLPIRWFPHPFFPQLETTEELCRVNIPVSFPESKAYTIAPSGFIARKSWPWDRPGNFQALDHTADTNLVIIQKHPVLGLVTATCSYTPAFFPVWGNTNTFSWEPFLEQTIAPGERLSWQIDYDF
jgi:hypothetical protein